jgi:tetratricopeptide (TPR) repeat protein
MSTAIKPFFACALLVLAAATAHWPAVYGAFIWDDESSIRENPVIVGAGGLRRIWLSSEQVDYWPVSYTTLWLEWRLWGDEPRAFRITNILLHGLNAVLVWRLARRLAVPWAWLGGLLFAIHPLSVEAVDWIIQRKTLLATGFALAALRTGLAAYQSRRALTYWAAVAMFLLAMLSKTSAVMTPLVLLVLIWWQTRRVASRDLRFAVPWFVVSALLGLVAVWFQEYRAIGEEVVRPEPLLSRLAAAGYAVWFYAAKALLPLRLSFVYPRWQVDPRWLPSYLPLVALVVLLAVLFWKRWTWGAGPLAALGYYLLNLLPVLGLADIYFMKYSLVADHWQYLALPGLLALGVGALGNYAADHPARRMPTVVVSTVGCLLLLLVCMDRAAVFGAADNEPLWRDTLAKNPDAWMADNNLGRLLALRGDWSEALHFFQEAVRLAPDDALSRYNLAGALQILGKRELAERHYKVALALRPKSVATLNQLGKLASASGRRAEARLYYERALAMKPKNAEALAGIGVLLCQDDKLEEGENYLRRALASDPFLAVAHHNLGLVQLRRGQLRQAGLSFQSAIDNNPGLVDAHVMLGETLYKLGKLPESTIVFRIAVSLAPNLYTARFGLGRSLADAGQLDDAAEQLKQSLLARPDFEPAQQKLAEVEARLDAGR